MTYSTATPAEVRALIRTGQLTAPTTGYCDGYAQGNLVVLPKALAWDFLLFCQRNPKACPLLEVADAGQRSFSQFAPGSDIAQDIPRYRIYQNVSTCDFLCQTLCKSYYSCFRSRIVCLTGISAYSNH